MEERIVPRKYVLCEDGFETVIADGRTVGFQVKLRIPEYRGLPLALVGGVKIAVDGVEYPPESMTFTSEGYTFTREEMETVTDVYWLVDQPLVVTVRTEAPPAPGAHKVAAYAAVRISYMPVELYAGEEKTLTLDEGRECDGD